MYVIYANCFGCTEYLKHDTVALFNTRLSKAHIFNTWDEADRVNVSYNIGGSIQKINSKELFAAKLRGK